MRTPIVNWLTEVDDAMRRSPWAKLLMVDCIDVADVLLSPLYLAALNVMRGLQATPESPAKALIERVHNVGYRLKTAYRERTLVRRSPPIGSTDVVLWSRDITHTKILCPVARALTEQGTSCRMLACKANVYNELTRYEPNALFTIGAWSQLVRNARREGARRAKELTAYGPWKLPSLANVDQNALTEAIRRSVIRLLPTACEAIANAQAILDILKARVLVVGNDLVLEGRAGCRVAATRGVPTAMFMHGSITGDALQTRHCADRMFVYGSIQRQELIDQGFDPQRIVVCGAPNLDDRPRPSGQIHPLLQSRLGLGPREPWILVATSGPGHRISHRHHQVLIENLVQLSLAFPQVPVVIKLHRKDHLEYYQECLRRCASARLVVVADGADGFPREIFDWLQGCSIVLTGASAVAVEAMLMDVPVITMDFCDEIHHVDFIDAKATLHVCTQEALLHAVSETLTHQNRNCDLQMRANAYLQEAFYLLDGHSSRRGAQAIHELVVDRTLARQATS